jgi:hypothetical protein
MQASKRPLVILALIGGAGFAAASCSASGEAVVGGDVVEVVPLRDTFEPCAADDECPIDDNCWDITIDYGDVVVTDSMCTHECFDDLDCPVDGTCADASRGLPLCYQLCIDDLDCPSGFACIEDFNGVGFVNMCMPF